MQLFRKIIRLTSFKYKNIILIVLNASSVRSAQDRGKKHLWRIHETSCRDPKQEGIPDRILGFPGSACETCSFFILNSLLGCPWKFCNSLQSWCITYLPDLQPTYIMTYNPFTKYHRHPSIFNNKKMFFFFFFRPPCGGNLRR